MSKADKNQNSKDMSTPPEKTNLARIRENQRRSRARRREYVQELEHRLRLVEMKGIEASAEIQVVARRVADENKKLRSLLNRHGVENDAIDGFLASSSLSASEITASPSRGMRSAPATTAAFRSPRLTDGGSSSRNGDLQELDHLLAPRPPSWCGTTPTLQDFPDMAGDERLASRFDYDSRETSAMGNNMIQLQSPVHGHQQQRNTYPDDGFSRSSQRILSPTSTAMADASINDPSHHRPSLAGTYHPLETSHSPHQPSYDYDYDMNMLHGSPFQHRTIPSHPSAQSGYSPPSRSASTTQSPTSSTAHNTSCSMAANVISSMVGVDPFQVRASLGCAPGVECILDNTAVSNAIDQLAASALGI